MEPYWPPSTLRVNVAGLELRLPSEADIEELSRVAAAGVHDPDEMPFLNAWTDGTPQERAHRIRQWCWRKLGEISPERWTLPFVVVVNGTVAGVQALGGVQFPIRRHVATGSWLGQDFHGQGYGTLMRSAALHLAFAELGALTAASAAFVSNKASAAVSRKLGYRPNGLDIDVVRGQRTVTERFLLERDHWRSRGDIHVHGIEPCLALLGATHQ